MNVSAARCCWVLAWCGLGLVGCRPDLPLAGDFGPDTTGDQSPGGTDTTGGGVLDETGATMGGTFDDTGEATCSDGEQSGDETDVDCGGSACEQCGDGAGCAEAGDCESGVCVDDACASASCTDTVLNGDETDVDCGGSCSGCPNGQACSVDDDCMSEVCRGDLCVVPACGDGVLNGAETDVDCGGPECMGCDPGGTCARADDCTSSVCAEQTCARPICGDFVLNGTEDCDEGGVETITCDADCSSAECGDGQINMTVGELCDGDGMGLGGETATCDADCTLPECGDGVANMAFGEQCDGDGMGLGGETALCDVDCTDALCGDGLVNATAAELCDGDGAGMGGETALCDVDCTPSVCGDGIVNVTVGEICDGDGMGVGGETAACDADCTAPLCGDGQVNMSSGELCDGDGMGAGGETAICDADCSLASCGDMTINASAGEECDDGNLDALDECTNGCLLTTCDDMVQNADEIDVDCGGRCGPGSCGAGQTCTEDADCSSMDCDLAMNVCVSNDHCLDLLDQGIVVDGVYSIDPDGMGPGAPFDVYCDMSSSGGGWTLIARFSNADAEEWMLDTGEMWYDRLTPTGVPIDPSLNEDAQSEAFWTVSASELRLTRSDEVGNPTLFRTNANCLGGADFRTFITAFGDFRNGAVWGSNEVAGTCPGAFEGSFAVTSGFEQALCSGDIGAPSSVSFWSDWGSGDGAVMMLGGGGNSCNRADHGIGVTEANAASFDISGTFENDFGSDAGSGAVGYSLNLWVR